MLRRADRRRWTLRRRSADGDRGPATRPDPPSARAAPDDTVEHRQMRLDAAWGDVELDPSAIVAAPDSVFHATVAIRSANPITLRCCVIKADRAECDFWPEYPPGVTQFTFTMGGMQQRRPGAGSSVVDRMLFGGRGTGGVDVMLAFPHRSRDTRFVANGARRFTDRARGAESAHRPDVRCDRRAGR
jgi:hypothetical protein